MNWILYRWNKTQNKYIMKVSKSVKKGNIQFNTLYWSPLYILKVNFSKPVYNYSAKMSLC